MYHLAHQLHLTGYVLNTSAGVLIEIEGTATLLDRFLTLLTSETPPLAREIAALCEPGRRYKFMEGCGGHTHTIYKHGLENYLPEQITLVHGPGCPVCVMPLGRIDDAVAIAAQPNVIMTSRSATARY